MTPVLLSRRAEADLVEIWRHTAERWGTDQADSSIGQIQTGLAILAVNPMAGSVFEELRGAYRRYRIGSHVLFYRIESRSLRIARVLHRSMDFGQHL
jgi:toxin ParE1/3/4